MTKVLFITFFMMLSFLSGQYKIKRAWLFSRKQYAGNMPTSPNGKQVSVSSTTLLCFIEIDKDQPLPVWKAAYYKGSKYTAHNEKMNGDSSIVGKEKDTQSQITIKADKANVMIEVLLEADGVDDDATHQHFMLEGTLNEKKVYLKINKPVVELTPALMP
jgi:hypothetical protein